MTIIKIITFRIASIRLLPQTLAARTELAAAKAGKPENLPGRDAEQSCWSSLGISVRSDIDHFNWTLLGSGVLSAEGDAAVRSSHSAAMIPSTEEEDLRMRGLAWLTPWVCVRDSRVLKKVPFSSWLFETRSVLGFILC